MEVGNSGRRECVIRQIDVRLRSDIRKGEAKLMNQPTVVIETCRPETANENVAAQVAEMLSKLPDFAAHLDRAKRIFIKLNLGVGRAPMYKGRPVTHTDPVVFEGLAKFLADKTEAKVLVGDGCCGITPKEAARKRGHMAIIEANGYQFVDLHQPPYARFDVPHPTMFRWYQMAETLKDVDLWISVAKMKAHHLCGVTLTMKNLFGLPPSPIYGYPRGALHSAIRLPGILADLTQLCTPAIGIIDGIIGGNYREWDSDPVTSGVLIAGENLVATDAVGARFMGADPQADRGTPPFIRADNHINLASEVGLGPADLSKLTLDGRMPTERRPFGVEGGAEPEVPEEAEQHRATVSALAQWYFDERECFVEAYEGQTIVLGNRKVLIEDAKGLNPTQIFKILAEEKLALYETFFKRVEAEEAELQIPYGC